jgi:hypothetical protein
VPYNEYNNGALKDSEGVLMAVTDFVYYENDNLGGLLPTEYTGFAFKGIDAEDDIHTNEFLNDNNTGFNFNVSIP